MVRVVAVVGAAHPERMEYFLNPTRVMWVAEGGPAFCYVQLAGSDHSLKVLEPAATLAKRLATAEPTAAEEVA